MSEPLQITTPIVPSIQIPSTLKESIGYAHMKANHGDPWDCIRYTGTLITDLKIVAELLGDKSLMSKYQACSKTWEDAVREFESSKDAQGNPNWGHPVLLCTRILALVGKDATITYGKIPTDVGRFMGQIKAGDGK